MRATEPERVVGVVRLAQFLKRLIEETPEMKRIAVRGEISNLHLNQGSGHCYFSLKERDAILNCFVHARNVPDLPPLREGAKVVASGAVTTYEKQGRYQLRAASVRFEGEGALFAAFELLRARLAQEGLFALERKRVLPRFPFLVALVSSVTADGARDFRTVARDRAPHVRVRLFETSVQGEHAPSQIVAAIVAAGESGADIVVVVRGGGSYEDLFAFSHESVVRAIHACPIPVLTGIGHESDVSLADHAADLRSSTPTDAATRLPAIRDVRAYVAALAAELLRRESVVIARLRERVASLDHRLERLSPRARLQERSTALLRARLRLDTTVRRRHEERQRRVERARERFQRAVRTMFERRRLRIDLACTALGGRDPHALLELGYAIVRIDGQVVKDATAIPVGSLLSARLARGTVEARVETTADDERTIGELREEADATRRDRATARFEPSESG